MSDNNNRQSSETPKMAGFKMSIAPKSDSAKKRKLQEKEDEEKRDYVTGINSNGQVQSYQPEEKKGPLVIPMPETRQHIEINAKYAKYLGQQEEKTQPTEGEEKPSNGELKTKTLDEEAAEELLKEAKGEVKTVKVSKEIELPMLIKYRDPLIDAIEDESEKFKKDVESRPEVSSLEDYEKVPIDLFGKALLRGMGWSEGTPIGLTNPKVIEPIEFSQRPGFRAGLGANVESILLPTRKKRKLKPGEKEEDFEAKVLPPSADGHIRHIKKLDEKLVPLSKIGIQPGVLVAVVSGSHDGLYARVLKILENDSLLIQLSSSYEEVVVSKSDVTMVNETELSESHPALQFMKTSKDQETNTANQNSDGTEKDKSKHKNSEKDQVNPPSPSSAKTSSLNSKSSWLFPQIVVRIVSKSFSNGKYYLKKGVIDDVISPSKCTVQLMDSNQLIDVEQKMLETVIPKTGEKVMIVDGEYRGMIGKLLSKDKNESGEVFAVVQLSQGLSVQSFDLDLVCHYVGRDMY